MTVTAKYIENRDCFRMCLLPHLTKNSLTTLLFILTLLDPSRKSNNSVSNGCAQCVFWDTQVACWAQPFSARYC